MAHYDAGGRVDHFAYAAMVPEVDLELNLVEILLKTFRRAYVAAAYAYVVDAYEDVVWVGEFGDGFIFDTSIFCAVNDYGWIFHLCDCG